MNAIFAMLDEHQLETEIYSQLMLNSEGLRNDDLLARMLASQAVGKGALPVGLGLAPKAYADMLLRHFPHAAPMGLGRGEPLEDARAMERRDLVDLLLEHRAWQDRSELWMAEIVAAACMGGDHLWQDLGLWSRRDLNQLMTWNFPSLAGRNERDMKWKKFLYRQICDKEGIPVCPAPSCQSCVDYDKCFNAVTGDK